MAPHCRTQTVVLLAYMPRSSKSRDTHKIKTSHRITSNSPLAHARILVPAGAIGARAAPRSMADTRGETSARILVTKRAAANRDHDGGCAHGPKPPNLKDHETVRSPRTTSRINGVGRDQLSAVTVAQCHLHPTAGTPSPVDVSNCPNTRPLPVRKRRMSPRGS
jgi:hypothetical protein